MTGSESAAVGGGNVRSLHADQNGYTGKEFPSKILSIQLCPAVSGGAEFPSTVLL